MKANDTSRASPGARYPSEAYCLCTDSFHPQDNPEGYYYSSVPPYLTGEETEAQRV